MPDTPTPMGLTVRKVPTDETKDRPPGLRDVAGVVAEGALPQVARIPMDFAQREEWIELVGQRPVVRPAGPPEARLRRTHTFVHADEIVLHLLDGDVHYRVVGQPDKYDADGEPTDAAGDPTSELRWFYDAELVGEKEA